MAIYHLCRICLTEGSHSDAMQPLFESENSHCIEIVRKIEECSGIELKLRAEFPKLICDQCLQSLDTSYKFRIMCQASEDALLDAIVKSELKTELHEADNTDAIRSNEEPEIFFDLHTEIIEAEELDLDMLTNRNAFEEDCLEDCVDSLSGITSNSELKIIQTRTKKILKRLPRKIGGCNKRGRPRLKQIAATLDNATVKNKSGRGRRRQVEVQDHIMCEICGNIYSKRAKLNMHMRRHMSEKPFDCEICSKAFACPSEIRRHMRVHTGEKPFACKFCGRTFADRSTNTKHERIHTNERPFTCNTCGKTFTYSNVLKNHMLIHTGEKPFSCSPCNKTFSRKHQLNQHYATLTHQQTIKNHTTLNTKSIGNQIIAIETEDSNDREMLHSNI